MKKVIFILILLIPVGLLIYGYGAFPSPWPENNATTTTNGIKEQNKPVERENEEFGISIEPDQIFQGDPVLITLTGVTTTTQVKSFTYNSRPLVFFMHQGKVTSLLGVDLRAATGTFPVVATLKDGRQARESLEVKGRIAPKAAFGIPDKLGGNTSTAERELVSTLVQEAQVINAIPTSNEKLWTEPFGDPLENTEISDIFGYTRLTGGSTFAHKGTDYRAAIGTPVFSMNSGMVRFSGFMRNYGHTVVVDHGLGLHTVYMHLSKITVTNGQMVKKGDQLGLSGDTGYVLGPHLHVTVRIWDISVDPDKFLSLMRQ